MPSANPKSTIDVLLFSVLRDRVGHPIITCPVDGAISGAELLERVANEHPEIAAYRSVIRLAVNQTYVSEQTTITPDDEVALITPVSGG